MPCVPNTCQDDMLNVLAALSDRLHALEQYLELLAERVEALLSLVDEVDGEEDEQQPGYPVVD